MDGDNGAVENPPPEEGGGGDQSGGTPSKAEEQPLGDNNNGTVQDQQQQYGGASGGDTGTGGSLALRPVFLGNLDHTYNTQDVIEIFERPIMPVNNTLQSYQPIGVERVDVKRGYCFVFLKDAPSQEAKSEAETFVGDINGMAIDRVSAALRVEFARGDGRIKRKEDDRRKAIQPSETLFVVNFHEGTTKTDDLKMLFEPYGELVRIDMKRNYAFVQFRTVDEAKRAKDEVNGGKLDQSVLTVEYVARQRNPSGGGPRGGGGDRRGPPPRRNDNYGGRYNDPPRGGGGGGYGGGPPSGAPGGGGYYDDRRGGGGGPPPPSNDRYYDDRGRGPPPPSNDRYYDDRGRGPPRYDDRGPPPRYGDDQGYRGGGRDRSRSPPPGQGYSGGGRYDDRRGGFDRDRGYDRAPPPSYDRYDDRGGGRGYDDRRGGY